MNNPLFSTKELEAIFNFSPMGLSVWDRSANESNWTQWTFVYGNDYFKSFLSQSSFDRLKAGDIPGDYNFEAIDLIMKQMIESDEAQTEVFDFSQDPSTYFWMKVDLIPLEEKYMACFFTNITDQYESAESLMGKVADFQEMNRYRVAREVKIASYKRQMNYLQQKLKQLGVFMDMASI